MERRKESRLETSEPAKVSVLSDPHQTMVGVVLNVSATGMNLIVPHPIPPEAAVQVETEDALLLGEASWCRRREDQQYFVGLESVQALHRLGEVEKLMRALVDEGERKRLETPARTI